MSKTANLLLEVQVSWITQGRISSYLGGGCQPGVTIIIQLKPTWSNWGNWRGRHSANHTNPSGRDIWHSTTYQIITNYKIYMLKYILHNPF